MSREYESLSQQLAAFRQEANERKGHYDLTRSQLPISESEYRNAARLINQIVTESTDPSSTDKFFSTWITSVAYYGMKYNELHVYCLKEIIYVLENFTSLDVFDQIVWSLSMMGMPWKALTVASKNMLFTQISSYLTTYQTDSRNLHRLLNPLATMGARWPDISPELRRLLLEMLDHGLRTNPSAVSFVFRLSQGVSWQYLEQIEAGNLFVISIKNTYLHFSLMNVTDILTTLAAGLNYTDARLRELLPFLAHALRRNAKHFSPDSILTVMRSLADMQIPWNYNHQAPSLAVSLSTAINMNLLNFSAPQTACVIVRLKRMGATREDIRKQELNIDTRLIERIAQHLKSFDHADLAAVFRSLAEMRVSQKDLEEAHIDTLILDAIETCQNLTRKELIDILWALATFNFDADVNFREGITDTIRMIVTSIQLCLETPLQPDEIVDILWSLASLHCQRRNFQQYGLTSFLCTQIIARADEFTAKESEKIMLSVSQLELELPRDILTTFQGKVRRLELSPHYEHFRSEFPRQHYSSDVNHNMFGYLFADIFLPEEGLIIQINRPYDGLKHLVLTKSGYDVEWISVTTPEEISAHVQRILQDYNIVQIGGDSVHCRLSNSPFALSGRNHSDMTDGKEDDEHHDKQPRTASFSRQ